MSCKRTSQNRNLKDNWKYSVIKNYSFSNFKKSKCKGTFQIEMQMMFENRMLK